MTELIITEKPQAAKKIAAALATGKPIEKKYKGVTYYLITIGDKDAIVGCAVGHLYSVVEKNKGKWTYPVFNTEWVPTFEANKNAAFSKKYLETLKKISKEADTFTVATDYDIEGEVIGLNIIRFLCKKKDAARMKFSTLTQDELIESYHNKSPHLDWGQANAGETRHVLDWLYGINLSRALTLSVKAATGKFKLLSIGRVQGPALKLLVEKEKEIQAFISKPFWQIELLGSTTKDNGFIDAWHKTDKFWDKKEADAIIKKTANEKKARVVELKTTQQKQNPPAPFDLTSLQLEAHKCFGITPRITLQIAQSLYTDSFISYPRTSSQKLPKSIGYEKILKALSKQKDYKKDCDYLLSKKPLIPNEGKKEDAAHPAIYPTGEHPKKLSGSEKKVYDLIVRRFFAVFGDIATRETMNIILEVKDELFIAKGTRTVEKGWHELYKQYVMLKEEELPSVKQGQEIYVNEIKLHDKETQPPRRYTAASIIKELEKRSLGTKATRAEIIEALYKRDYVDEKSIQVTELGMRTFGVLDKYSPKILDEKLTRHFEDEMEEIRQKKKTPVQVLDEAKEVLKKLLDDFKKKEKQIGEELQKANIETRDEMNTIGPCPNCSNGKLQIRRGKFGFFIACNRYPDCETTYSLPSNGIFKPAKKNCEACGSPMVKVIKKRKKPQIVCINLKCPKKAITDPEKKKEIEDLESGKLIKPCPRCKEKGMNGHIVLRKSVYGIFYGCSAFPKCFYIEKIQEFPTEQENGDDENSSKSKAENISDSGDVEE